jgi:subtilase family serine protease
MQRFFQRLAFRTKSVKRPQSRPRVELRAEVLESRTLLSFTPNQIAHAYGFDYATIYDAGFNPIAQGDGSGQTIAIVIAYDNPYISNDLTAFDNAYGIPAPPSFQKAYPQGTAAFNSGWAQESALDVEYSHAMAPGANILLVEARSNSTADLYGAVDYARRQPGVSVVSMSWGGGESSGETSSDRYFTTPGGHNGVTFVASSGDAGGARSYPAMSPNVVSVGGTNLSLSGTEYGTETAWSSSGGGVSSYESQPYWQADFYTNTHRAGPDVSYIASSSNGVIVRYSGANYVFGGTSVGAPQWAAMMAIVDQQLNAWGYDTLDGPTQALPGLYGIADWYGNGYYDGADFHDVVGGSAGGHPAVQGYDLATGLGSPIAYNLAVDLAYYTAQNIDGGPYSPAPQYRSHAPEASLAGDVVPVAESAGQATLMSHLQVAAQGNDPTSWVLVAQSRTASVNVSMPAAIGPRTTEGSDVVAGSTPERTATTASAGTRTRGAMATPPVASLHDGDSDLSALDALFTTGGWGNP